jgi:hypothetical protein
VSAPKPRFEDGSSSKNKATAVEDVSTTTTETDLLNRIFKSENPNHEVTFGTVNLDDLRIDERIQRAEQTREIINIAEDFNPGALGTLTVSVRELPGGAEEQILLDGQQRRAACLRVGWHGKVRAVIHRGLTLAEEARLFRQLNFRQSVNAQTLFKVALSEGDSEALAIKAVLDALGLSVSMSSFGAVNVARRVVRRRGGLTHFQWALEMIQKIYDMDRRGAVYDGRVVEAFALLHERYLGQLDEANLIKKLSGAPGGMQGLIGHGRTVREVKGGQIVPALIDAIITRYNTHKHRDSRTSLPLWERRAGSKTGQSEVQSSRKAKTTEQDTPTEE